MAAPVTAALAVRSNEDAEEAVLGALIESPANIALAVGRPLHATAFFRERNRKIFAEIVRLNSNDEPTGYSSLVESFEGCGQLDDVGGKLYLSGLEARKPPAGHERRYIDIVKAAARDRRKGEVLSLLQAPGLNGDGPALVAELSQLIDDAALGELRADRWTDGASFILDGPDHVEPIWGRDAEVVFADGEPLLIVSQPGAGKTTLAQQLSLRLAGVVGGDLLGLPVKPVLGKVVYVAADRPSQAARSFRRMVDDSQRTALAECLDVWRGPLPFDFAADPHLLYPFLRERGAGAVVIDSLGATAYNLASDEAGGRIFSALGEVTAEGVQVVVIHHDRKGDGNDRAKTLNDVYGSRLITAAAGSVIYLDGQPGDLVMGFRHMKQPAEEVGPLTIQHDHQRGSTVIYEKADLLDMAMNGITVKEAACSIFDTAEPTKSEVEKARRRLTKLEEGGRLRREGDPDKGETTIYTTATVAE